MHTFEAVVWPEGRWWVVEIPELETAGQAASFSGTAQAAREVCSAWLDVDETAVRIELAVRIPQEVRRTWESALELERRSRALQDEAAVRRRQAVAALGREYTHEAAAAAFGVSPQRVAQLHGSRNPAAS